ncbi:hypothetical protein [Flavobacterium facile]|uniref:hypothetical protein n=1 Tax=Flavobacterium facile TaxID=2893174 RepID=UPI002E76C602|nr:hypothetical protein [Flavobacterium sp. T-12]
MKSLQFNLYILFLMAFSTSFYAQEKKDSLKIPFISYWSKGDVYKFKVKKFEEKWKDDKIVKNDSIIYDATFTVLDSTATSYKIKWSYKIDATKTFNLPGPLSNAFSKLKDIEIIYTTSEVGDFTGVENWEEISKKMKEMTSELMKLFPDDKDSEIKKGMQQLFDIYNSKEGIETYLTKDIQMFHYPFGAEFNTEKELVYEEELPNPFGGKPIKAISTLYFDEVDEENSRCVFYRNMSIDPKDTKELVADVFKKLAPKDKSLKEFAKNMVFEVNDTNGYDYVYNPGVPIYIFNEREIIMKVDKKNEKKIDRLEIELTE